MGGAQALDRFLFIASVKRLFTIHARRRML